MRPVPAPAARKNRAKQQRAGRLLAGGFLTISCLLFGALRLGFALFTEGSGAQAMVTVSLALLAVAGPISLIHWYRRLAWSQAQGVVVSRERHRGDDGPDHLIISFATPQGQFFQAKAEGNDLSPGAKVQLLYNVARPTEISLVAEQPLSGRTVFTILTLLSLGAFLVSSAELLWEGKSPGSPPSAAPSSLTP